MKDNIGLITLASRLQTRLQTRRLQEAAMEDAGTLLTKNLCAKVAPQLAEEVQEMARFLGISKRLFVEQAVVDALDRASFVIWEQADEDDENHGTLPTFVYDRLHRECPHHAEEA